MVLRSFSPSPWRAGLTVALLAVLTACSGSRGSAPLAPPPGPALAGLYDYTPVTALVGAAAGSQVLESTFGSWTLSYADGTAALTPDRQTQAPGIGTFDVDVTKALSQTFCTDCLRIGGISVDVNGHPVITLEARHPFAVGNQALPESATNRNDLFVFNLKGIVASDRTPTTNPLGATVSPDLLRDPDGYFPVTTLFDTTGLTGQAFPYMTFGVNEALVGTGNFNAGTGLFDDLNAPDGFNVFGQGQTVTADFTLDIDTGESVDWRLVTVVRYGKSNNGPGTRLAPFYYPAEIASEAWRVTVEEPAVPFTDNAGDFEDVEVSVWDFGMAHGALDAGYPGTNYLGMSWDPDLTVEFACPSLVAGTVAPTGAPSGTGAIGDPLLYTFSISNQLGAANGEYLGFVKVTSNRPVTGTANPADPSDVSGVKKDLSTSDLVPYDEIATYQLVSLEVFAVVGLPPVADLDATWVDILEGNGTYLFPGPATMDPDGTIVEYSYDFDWDTVPLNFVADITVLTSTPVAARFPTAGPVIPGLRVKDNSGNYGYGGLNLSIAPATADPFPVGNPQGTFQTDDDEIFLSADKQCIAMDPLRPWNVYMLQNNNPTGEQMRIYRSTNYGQSFDTGTDIQTTFKLGAGDSGCSWTSGKAICVLANGDLGVIFSTTTSVSATCTGGRALYYGWVRVPDTSPAGVGVDPGTAGSHDLVSITSLFPNDTCASQYSDVSAWGHTTDPTIAYVTTNFNRSASVACGNPNGYDSVLFLAVANANTATPGTLVQDEVRDITGAVTTDNVFGYLDRSNNNLHMMWQEFDSTGPMNYIAYNKIVINNPGTTTRLSATTVVGLNAPMENGAVSITTGGQAVVSFRANFNPAGPLQDYDPVLVKVNDLGGGSYSFGTPQRIVRPLGQDRTNVIGDPANGRITLFYMSGGTTGFSGLPLTIEYQTFDSNLAPVMPSPGNLVLSDPGGLIRHDEIWAALDPNTGRIYAMWQDDGATSATEFTSWRYSR